MATVTFGQTLDGPYNVTINAFNTVFTGNIGLVTPLASLVTDANGTTRLGASVTSINAGELVFGDNVTFAGPNLTVVAANATFNKSLNAVTQAFNGTIDSVFTIANNLTLVNAGNLINFGNITADVGGSIFLGGGDSANYSIAFEDKVILISATTVTSHRMRRLMAPSTGPSTWPSTPTKPCSIAPLVRTTPLGRLITNAAGSTTISNVAPGVMASVTASNISFGDNVTLTGDFTMVATSPNGTTTFGQNVDGGYNLSITSFNTTFASQCRFDDASGQPDHRCQRHHASSPAPVRHHYRSTLPN